MTRVPRTSGASAAVYFLLVSCSDRVGGHYPTYTDAERADAIRRGVIPTFVPRSATDIWEEHDLDTNEQWLRFRLPAGDTALLIGGQQMTGGEARSLYRQPPSGLSEMPAGFRGKAAPDTSSGALRFVRYPAERAWAFCVAYDRKAAFAYVWTCSGTG
jgi:hypothetical protein